MIGLGILNVQSQDIGTGPKSNWSVFVAPHGSFQVELPGAPIRSPRFNPGKKDETRYFRCTKSLNGAYNLDIKKTEMAETYFSIGEFDVTKCKRNEQDLAREARKLILTYGVDDPSDKLESEKELVVDGQLARMFVVSAAGGAVYTWSLFVQSETRVFWMYYTTNDSTDNMKDSAERIFRSFRVGNIPTNKMGWRIGVRPSI